MAAQDMDDLFGADEEDANVVAPQPTRLKSNGPVAFHNGTEEAMLLFVSQHAERGNPTSVLRAVDRFCYERHWMMHMGEEKSPIVENTLRDALRKRSEETETSGNAHFSVIELGSYCGYSAVCIAKEFLAFEKSLQCHVWCIEINPQCARWTQRLVDFAGLSSFVTVLQAPAKDCSVWRETVPGQKIDVLFIDHDKKSYFDDLKTIESANLLQTGSVVIADNVLCFNHPLVDYLEHVRNPQGLYSHSELFEGFLEYTSSEERLNSAFKDGLEVSIYRG